MMPFQPLIVVILLIFLVLLSFALFLWSLLSMGRAKNIEKKQKTVTSKTKKESQNIGYLRKQELANKKLEERARQLERKPKPAIKPKPTIPPYQELRPISKNRASKTARDAKKRIDNIKIAENLEVKLGSFKSEKRKPITPKDIKPVENTEKKAVANNKDLTKPKIDKSATSTKNDSYRGLHAVKVEKPQKILDPFDSFVESNKKLG